MILKDDRQIKIIKSFSQIKKYWYHSGEVNEHCFSKSEIEVVYDRLSINHSHRFVRFIK